MRRFVGGRIGTALAVSALAGVLGSAHTAVAHDGNTKLRGTCEVINLAGRGTMTVTVENLGDTSVRNVSPSDLLASGTGTATFFLQTSPRQIREILGGKRGTFTWKGRLYGDGVIDLSVEMFAEFEDGHIESTGIINCNRLVVGNPDEANPPTLTPAVRATNTPAVRTSTPTRARPTLRPTRTPRLVRTATPTRAQATATSTRVPPTRTPTRTATAQRATRTPRIVPTRTPTRTSPARPSATATRPRPTRTPIPPRPTRTRMHTPTQRPTRTLPGSQPTATRTPGTQPSGDLVASCSIRRNIDFVIITMAVENRTGADIRQVTASPLNLEPEGGSLFFDRAGPSPGSVSLLRNGVTTTFQWTGRLSPGGTMGFSAYASANGPNGPLRTPLIDCGVTGSEAANFDPSSFSGTCSIQPGEKGLMKVQLRNGSRETLENIEGFFITRATTGTATVLNIRGPAPRNIRTLSPGARREFVWEGRFLGTGNVSMRFEGRASRATSERISTGPIECAVELGASAGELPDLAVDQNDLRDSILIESQHFSADHCAVFEGCVDGSGLRRLLRFNTTTPNYGPGDVFMGDPRNTNTFEYSSCHDHYHFREYADYRLLDMAGNIVARGHKQAFCLVDLWQPPGLRGRSTPQFNHCGFQGISAGWADVYHRGLDCQWIDITGVPSGRYVLEVVVNPARVIREHNYTNNTARTEVVIP